MDAPWSFSRRRTVGTPRYLCVCVCVFFPLRDLLLDLPSCEEPLVSLSVGENCFNFLSSTNSKFSVLLKKISELLPSFLASLIDRYRVLQPSPHHHPTRPINSHNFCAVVWGVWNSSARPSRIIYLPRGLSRRFPFRSIPAHLAVLLTARRREGR